MIEMETCGKHLAPNMQTISSIFKGALTTFGMKQRHVQYLTYVYICHGLPYNRPHTSRIY